MVSRSHRKESSYLVAPTLAMYARLWSMVYGLWVRGDSQPVDETQTSLGIQLRWAEALMMKARRGATD